MSDQNENSESKAPELNLKKLLEQAEKKIKSLEQENANLKEDVEKKKVYIKGLNTKLKKVGISKPAGFIEH